jgi:uncharacterized integral membrane protein
MKLLVWLALLGLVLLGMFAVANWSVLIAPANLNFLAFTVEGPLGVILIGVTLLFVLIFAAYALSLRTSMLLEARRQARALDAQRDLAEHSEASRYTELRTHVDAEFARLRETAAATRAETLERMEALERSMREHIDQAATSLSAYVGEVDEKLDRITLPPGRS